MSYHGMGTAVADAKQTPTGNTLVVAALTVQKSLYERGGNLAVDGVFGPESTAALNSMLGRTGAPTNAYAVSPDRRTVVFHVGTSWQRVLDLPRTRTYVAGGGASAPAPISPIDEMPEEIIAPDESGADMTPWLVGAGVVVAGLGAYFVMRRRRAMAANRRRRNRRR